MSSSIVGYLKMLVTLGTLRFQLSDDYDLAETVRSFVRKLARQRAPAGSIRGRPRPAHRRDRARPAGPGLRGVPGSQESFLGEAQTSLFGFRRRIRYARRRLVRSAYPSS